MQPDIEAATAGDDLDMDPAGEIFQKNFKNIIPNLIAYFDQNLNRPMKQFKVKS